MSSGGTPVNPVTGFAPHSVSLEERQTIAFERMADAANLAASAFRELCDKAGAFIAKAEAELEADAERRRRDRLHG